MTQIEQMHGVGWVLIAAVAVVGWFAVGFVLGYWLKRDWIIPVWLFGSIGIGAIILINWK